MNLRRLLRGAVIALLALVTASVISAVTAANTVPTSRAGNPTQAIDVNSLKPAACSSITVVSPPVTGSGNFSGTNADELILGSTGVDSIDGKNGSDCILGGGGNDSLDGGAGTDVCIGGPGTDSFNRCETEIQ